MSSTNSLREACVRLGLDLDNDDNKEFLAEIQLICETNTPKKQ